MESSLHCRSRGWKISNLEGGGGGLTPENILFMVYFDRKIVFLTLAGFGIFGPHKILGVCAGFACCGGGMRAPGGGASRLGVERPGSGALPRPTIRLFGRAAGAGYPLAVGAGLRAWGPVTNPTERALASWLCAL